MRGIWTASGPQLRRGQGAPSLGVWAKDQSAGAGVRVFDNSGFFYDSRKDFYIKAPRPSRRGARSVV